jgi:hypothetical protein
MPYDLDNDKPWVKVITNQQQWETYFYATTAAVTYPIGIHPHYQQLVYYSAHGVMTSETM